MIAIFNTLDQGQYPYGGIRDLITDSKEDINKAVQFVNTHSTEHRHVTAKVDLGDINTLRNFGKAYPTFNYAINALEPGLEIFFSDLNANFSVSARIMNENLITENIMYRMRQPKRAIGDDWFTVGYVHGKQYSEDWKNTIGEWYSLISLNDTVALSPDHDIKEIAFITPDYDDLHEIYKHAFPDDDARKCFWESERVVEMKHYANSMLYVTKLGFDTWINCQQVLKYKPLEETLSAVPTDGEIDINLTLRKLASFIPTNTNLLRPGREQVKWIVDTHCLKDVPYWRNGNWANWERVEEAWNNPSGDSIMY